MFCCLVGDQRPACRCNSLRGTINAIPLQIPWPDGVGGGKRTRLLDQACHLLRSTSGDKADLLPYRRQKIAFILFFDCFFSLSLARAYTHTHTHTLCLFLSPLLPYYPTLFSLPFLLCFHYSPFVPTFSKPLSPLPDFSVSISNDDSIYGIALFLLPSPSFPSVCSFRLSVFAAALLRLFSALVRSFTLSRLMHFYRKLQVKTFR